MGPLAALIVAFALIPSIAAGAACPSTDTSYTGNCGSTFAVPAWTDASGWTDPSQYSTIRLADVNGDGRDELLGRNSDGLEVYDFDTSLGQWRPQVDANNVRQLVSSRDANGNVVSDFASPSLSNQSDPHRITGPQYYSTIRAANIDGKPGDEILARFWDGMRVYKYFPPSAGGNSIDGGTWKRIGTGGPFSDAQGWSDPSLYSTITTGRVNDDSATPVLIGRSHAGTVGYTWNGSGWTPIAATPDPFFADSNCGAPSCYRTLRIGRFDLGQDIQPPFQEIFQDMVTGRSGAYGATGSVNIGSRWSEFLDAGGAFSDNPGQPDCPFPGTNDCLGSAPSYYETYGTADFDGDRNDELYARAADGLRVESFSGVNFSGRLATLTDLAGAASNLGYFLSGTGRWGSIRTGNIDGAGGDEVLALDGQGLQAWSYNKAANTWNKLQPSTPLALRPDPWLTHPEYYSTIQVGDVDGDGRADVVARGPSGIRTWFYNRRGTGGWERYLPEGYPDFPERTCPAGVTGPCGQTAAYAWLQAQAKVNTGSSVPIREVWASATKVPQPGDLTAVNTLVTDTGHCSGAQAGLPLSYQACTPPPLGNPPVAPPDTFTATEWTAMINELLAEEFWAQEAVSHFKDVSTILSEVVPTNATTLDAIYQQLGVQAAANSANATQFNTSALWSLISGIAGSITGLVQPELGAGLAIASYLFSALPSASPSAMSSFSATYADLATQFATMVGDMSKAEQTQGQAVFRDLGQMTLVGQLRLRQTWNPDTDIMEGVANQGFAAWVYQNLMPTLYDRYTISNCTDTSTSDDIAVDYFCPEGTAPSGTGVIPSGGGPNFTTIAQPFSDGVTPCHRTFGFDENGVHCTFNLPPSTLMNQIWGPVTPDCSNTPGDATTKWTFGNCSAGVDVNTSIGANTWGFFSNSGAPETRCYQKGCRTAGASTAQARAGARPPVVLSRPRLGRRPARRGRARFVADVAVPSRLKLRGATFTLARLLFERRGRGELLRPLGRRVPPLPRRLTLRRTGAGRFAATATKHRRSVRVTLRRVPGGATRLTLTASAPTFRTPQVCDALSGRFGLRSPTLRLETLLFIGDGHHRFRLLLPHELRCARDRRGNIDRLVTVRTKDSPERSGLAVSLRGPSRVRPGSTVRYLARVQNRRSGKRRLASSVWDVVLHGGRTTRRIHELRRGRSRTFTVVERVPRGTRGRFCGFAVATAPDTRAALDTVCSSVRAAQAPGVTG
jgi:hypothetical protein